MPVLGALISHRTGLVLDQEAREGEADLSIEKHSAEDIRGRA